MDVFYSLGAKLLDGLRHASRDLDMFEALVRIHGITHERPRVRFDRE